MAGGAAFLLLPVGGRTTALGQAGAVTHGSLESVFFNPAGIARLDRSRVGGSYGSTFISDNTVLGLALANPRIGTAAVHAYLVDYGSQEITSGPGVVLGRLSPKNIALIFSLATPVTTDFVIGVSYKLVQFRQDCSGICRSPGGTLFESVVGTTQALDAGAQWAASDRITLAATLRHAGFALQVENRDQADPLPTRFGLGAAYWLPIHIEPDAPPARLELIVEVDESLQHPGSPELKTGVEVSYAGVVALRGGYAFLDSDASGPSLGVGISLGGVTVDVARVFFLQGDFEEPVYVSLSAGI